MFTRKRMLKKFFVLLTIVTILGLNVRPFATAHADSVANVGLLENVSMKANLTNDDIKVAGPYDLKLTLAGDSVLNLQAISPEKSAVFYNTDVAKKWYVEDGAKANVNVTLLPITLADLPPELVAQITGLADTLSTDVNGTLGLLTPVVDQLKTLPVVKSIEITGDEELLGLVNNLPTNLVNDLLKALNGVLVYDEDIVVNKGANGEMIVTYSDGLGNRLNAAINKVVVNYLTKITNAINALSIDVDLSGLDEIPVVDGVITDVPVLGGLLGNLLENVGGTVEAIANESLDVLLSPNGLLNDVKLTLLGEVNSLVTDVTGLLVDLLNDVSIQALGKTTIEVPLKVVKPSGLDGEYKVYGELVKPSAINLELLSNLKAYDKIYFNEKTAVVTTPVTTTTVSSTPATTTTSGSTLPNTSTDMWMYGLTGISTLIAGIGTRRFARRK